MNQTASRSSSASGAANFTCCRGFAFAEEVSAVTEVPGVTGEREPSSAMSSITACSGRSLPYPSGMGARLAGMSHRLGAVEGVQHGSVVGDDPAVRVVHCERPAPAVGLHGRDTLTYEGVEDFAGEVLS